MKVKFNVTSKGLNKILKKENEEILGKIVLGKNYQKRRKTIERIFAIVMVIVGGLLLENSYSIFSKELIDIMKFGFILTIIGAILTIFLGNKFSLGYLVKERMKFIKERNKDILLATDNYDKEEFDIDAELEVKGDFIEINFGNIKKVYGIDSIKSVQVNEILVILEFKTRKYFIKTSNFKSKADIKNLEKLANEKREKQTYEIKEKIIEEINLNEYDIKPIKEIDTKKFIKSILKLQKKETVFFKYMSEIGLFIMVLASGEISNELIKVGIFIVVTCVAMFTLVKSNGEGLFIHKSKKKSKFYSNIGFKKIRIYLGEQHNYIFVGDDITIIDKEDMEIIKEEEKIFVKLFKKEFFQAIKKESNAKVILETQKNIDIEQNAKVAIKELKNKLRRLYINKKIFVFMGIWSLLIIVLGNAEMKDGVGILFILIGYLIFYINGSRLEKKLNILVTEVKEYKKKNINKNTERKINIKIFKDKAILEEKHVRGIYPISEVEVRKEDIVFGTEYLPINVFMEDEIKIIGSLNKKNKESLKKDKEVIIEGKKNVQKSEEVAKKYKKIVMGLFNSGFIGCVIATIGVGIAINIVISAGLILGLVLIYFTMMKTLKNDALENFKSNSGMYINKNKLYVEAEAWLEEYDLNALDIEQNEKEILIKREGEILLFIKPTEEAVEWLKITK